MRSSLLGVLALLAIAMAPLGAAVGGGGMAGGGDGAGMGGGGRGGGMGEGGGGVGLAGGGGGMVGGGAGNNVMQPSMHSIISLKFDIVISTPGSTKLIPSTLSFREKTVESDFLGKWNINSLPFLETPNGETGVLFAASMRDDDGNSLKMRGAKSGAAIKGTIVVHQVQGNVTSTFSFHGGIHGSLEGIAAKK